MMLVCWMGGETITGRWPSCGDCRHLVRQTAGDGERLPGA